MIEFDEFETDESASPETDDTRIDAEGERGEQLQLSEQELKLLATQVDSDYQNAINDHEVRCNRNKVYYELWRSRIGGTASDGSEGRANFKVPLTKWQLLGKLAKEVDALLGDDMQVVAVPVAPIDQAMVAKVGLWQTWRVKNDMKITKPLIEFLFNKLCYGRSFAYLPYDIETYTQKGEAVVWREGPKFIPIEPDDFIVPSERAKCLHDFSFVIRRYLTTPDELLEGETGGMYFGITDNWQNIIREAQDGTGQAADDSHPIADSKDFFEGVPGSAATSMGEFLEVIEWYGNWRMLKRADSDAQPDDLENREMRRTELVVRYLRNSNRIISVQRLEDLYPNIPKRRPFVETSLFKTNEYWSPGIPEMLIDIEAELTVNNNLTTEAGEASVGPLIGVRPSAAQKLKQTHWEPRLILEVDDPERDIRMFQLNVDMRYALAQEQKLRSYAELVTGLPEQSLGRAPDRPNAPRTARGQILLDENANIRLGLDMLVVKEDFKEILQRIWMLDVEYAPEEMFFRVTETQAKGLFDTDRGFARMTAEERAGRFDFDIQFATSLYSREAYKEREMALAQLSLGTMLVAQNPLAQWQILNNLYKAFGNHDFKSIVAKPPAPDLPVEPDEEWARALQGLDIHVHALDQDVSHIDQHKQALAEQMATPLPRRDKGAINRMLAHIVEHEKQKEKKLQMAARVAAQMTAMNMLGLGSGGDQQIPEQMPGMEQMPEMPGMPGMIPDMPGMQAQMPDVPGAESEMPGMPPNTGQLPGGF